MKHIASIVGVFLVGLCSAVALPRTDSAADAIHWLDSADVNSDFRLHVIHRHDRRFVGVYGFTAMVRAVDAHLQIRLIEQRRVRYIKGTSDAITSEEFGHLVDKANSYARRYNTLLLGYLREHPNT